jgi:hypothetical protein
MVAPATCPLRFRFPSLLATQPDFDLPGAAGTSHALITLKPVKRLKEFMPAKRAVHADLRFAREAGWR